MSRSSIPRTLRETVLHRDGGRRQYCGLAQFGHGATFHINHVIPRSRGGDTVIDNLVLQCPNCSLHKANKTTALDTVSGEVVALFHPRHLKWAEHFRLNSDGTYTGLTPIGRATVSALRMNDNVPRFARVCQMMLGLIVLADS